MARTVSATPVKGKYPTPLIHCTGTPETGKTQLAISFAIWLAEGPKSKCYVWPTDGREHEYAIALGQANVLAPVANPLDVTSVHDEIMVDLRAGVFKPVALFSVDTVTHIYRQASMSNQLKTLTKQTSSGHSLKAITMMMVVTIMMEVNLPCMAITHVYEAADKNNLEKKNERDSISPTEEARWKLAFNLKIQTLKDKKGYAIIVRECRERPGMKPFMLRDVPGGMFRTMPARLMTALYEAEIPLDEPKGWKEFGIRKPFPDKGEQFKQNAVREMTSYFIGLDGERFYAFGDPAAVPIKKDGEPGVNGAVNHALNAYAKLARQFKEDGGKSLGELTQKLKEYTEAKAKEVLDAYLDDLSQASQAEQSELPMEVEAPAPVGGGAAYVN